MITRNPTVTGLFMATLQSACKIQQKCSLETWLSRNVCNTKKIEFAGKVKTDQRVKSLRNLGSQFDISVGAVNNILKRKHEYQNLGDPFG